MKTRHFLARTAAVLTASAAIGLCLVPGGAEEARDDLDGWGNRDLDIGAFSQATANGIGSILDGWANRDLDVGPFAQGLPQSGDRSSISG